MQPSEQTEADSRFSSRDAGATRLRRLRAFLRRRETRKLAACYWAVGCTGWNDASLGPLIPYMEKYFNVSYTLISLMFVSSCVGAILAGVSNNRLTDRLGMGRMITIGAMLQSVVYAAVIAPPPFAVLPAGCCLVGLGTAYQNAHANAWVAGMPDAHIKLGYLHCAYGLGAFASPLVATAFIQSGVRFSYFFAVSLGVTATDILVLFRFFWRGGEPADHDDQTDHEDQKEPNNTTGTEASAHEQNRIELDELRASTVGQPIASSSTPAHPAASQVERTSSAKDKELFTNKTVWITAVFLFLYQGSEVSIGGWIVSFLIDERGGGPSVGFVASGFWGGLALGRLVLPRFNAWIGESNVVYFYTILAISFELVVWFARELIANAVAVSLVGFFLGPFFPIAISVTGKLLPKHMHVGAVGLLAASASAGAAIFPFATGALAQKYGPWVLQPMIVSLLSCMTGIWFFVPRPPQDRKRR